MESMDLSSVFNKHFYCSINKVKIDILRFTNEGNQVDNQIGCDATLV